MIEKTCEVCGVIYSIKNYRKNISRFCSKQCMGSWHAKNRLAYIKKPWAAKNLIGQQTKSPTKFTHERTFGRNNPRWVESIKIPCQYCGIIFEVKPWYIHSNGKPRFCSLKCVHESGILKGENSVLWVGGPTTYRGKGWQTIREIVIAKQQGKCAFCGKFIGKSLPVHHVHPFRMFSDTEQANSINNLKGLCQSCHMKHENK